MNTPSSTARGPRAAELLATHRLVGRVERTDDGLRVWVRAEDLRVDRGEDGIVLGAWVVEHLDQWSEVYELTYRGADQDPALDLSGWRASDTGQPFPREQMVEWADRTVELILRTRPRAVLEIGCGTGILLHRLMPSIDRYLGLDVAHEVIARHRVSGISGAAFCRAAAHDLRTTVVRDALAELGTVDTVVINSVTQCFGSVDYLAAVVHDAISIVRPGGAVFVGDVRHSGLLQRFEAWLTSVTGDTARVPTRDDTEMLADPPTLAQIAAGAPRPTRLVTLPRPLSADTELSRFRFDAIFLVDAHHRAAGPADDIDWVPNALLTEAPGGRTAAQLVEECTGEQLVVLHPDDPNLIGIANNLDAAAYTVEQVTVPACPHQPLGAFAQRRLAEECRRVLRREGLPRSNIEVQLPWSAPRSWADSTAIDRAWDAPSSVHFQGRGHSRLATAVAQLNQVALQALAQFFREHSPLAGRPAGVGEVCAALNVAPRHTWVVARWLRMLVEHGWAEQAEDRFRLTSAAPRAELLPDGPLLARACTRLGYSTDMVAFFRTSLQMQEDLLTDRASIQALMFPDGDLSTMLSKDQGNVGHRYIHGVLRAAVADIASGKSGPLRVLELGGGAGGATQAVLEGLGEAPVEYLFTDVSPFFLEVAKDRFSGLEFAVADINANLSAQGLAPGQELVVAVNVLHCATSVGSSLRWIRDLVAPQGCLVLVEGVRDHPIIVATMQCMLSGQEGDAQVGSGDRRSARGTVLMSSSALRAELAEAGWLVRRELPRPGSPADALGQILMVCTPTEPVAPRFSLGPQPSRPALPEGLSATQVDADVRAVDRLVLLGLLDQVARCTATGRDRWTAAELANELRVVPRHRWVIDRWLDDLTEHGLIDRAPSGYNRLKRPSRAEIRDARTTMMQAAARLGYGPILARTLLETLRRVPELLRDEVVVQHLLYPSGGIEFAEDVYGTNVVSRYLNAAAAALIVSVTKDGPVRVLELGAGIGATTAAVAASGVALDRYVYTDLSPWFLQLGRQQFGERLPLSTVELDIDQDFASQLAGHVVPCEFDVVMAATMAHNARDVGVLLARIRRVLRPGGHLILIETVKERPQSLTTMPFALSASADRTDVVTLDPGSGLRRDDERRGTRRTYLTEGEWLAHLATAGFDVQTPLPDPEHPLYPTSQRMLVGRSTHRPKETTR